VTTVLVTHDQEEAMDVADRVALLNEGRIEQIGKPRDLYEHPANEFVMSFVGPVNRFGDAFVRPHDIEITLTANGSTREANVQRIVHLGFEVRVELLFLDGTAFWAQVTRREAEELALTEGDRVYVRPSREKVFAEAG
jgi:sulfate transport system ATP-binding protein